MMTSAISSVLVMAAIVLGDGQGIDCKIANAKTKRFVPFRVIVKPTDKKFDHNPAELLTVLGKILNAPPSQLSSPRRVGPDAFSIDSQGVDISQAAIFSQPVPFTDEHFKWIERDPYIFAHQSSTPDDFYYAQSLLHPLWGLKEIGAPAAWSYWTGADTVVAAIVDSGVSTTHEDLPALWSLPTQVDQCQAHSVGYDAISNLCVTSPRGDHATRMAGVIGAIGNNQTGVVGVNWKIGLLSSTFMQDNIGCADVAVNALEYVRRVADTAHVRVVNLSWGTSEDSSALHDELRLLSAAGLVLVAAAGNSHDDIDQHPVYPAAYKDLPTLISVANTKEDGNLGDDSNYGANSVHIAAPGLDIMTTSSSAVGGYFNDWGTSIAAAFVTGSVGLLSSRCGKLTGKELRELLLDKDSVEDRKQLFGNQVEKNRFLNVGKAMKKCVALP
jgi:hypothetical protein